jgi:hypothetical protein
MKDQIGEPQLYSSFFGTNSGLLVEKWDYRWIAKEVVFDNSGKAVARHIEKDGLECVILAGDNSVLLHLKNKSVLIDTTVRHDLSGNTVAVDFMCKSITPGSELLIWASQQKLKSDKSW